MSGNCYTSLREFQEWQCKRGIRESCVLTAYVLNDEQYAERIGLLCDTFASNVDRLIRETDKKIYSG